MYLLGILPSTNPNNLTRDHFSVSGTHRLTGKNEKIEKDIIVLIVVVNDIILVLIEHTNLKEKSKKIKNFIFWFCGPQSSVIGFCEPQSPTFFFFAFGFF